MKEYKVQKAIGVYDLSNNFKGFLKQFLDGNYNEYYKFVMKFHRNKYQPKEVELKGERVLIKHVE